MTAARGFVTVGGNVITETEWNQAWTVLVTAMADHTGPFADDAAIVAYELSSGPVGRLMAGAA